MKTFLEITIIYKEHNYYYTIIYITIIIYNWNSLSDMPETGGAGSDFSLASP